MGPKLHEQQTQRDDRLATIVQTNDHLELCETFNEKSNNTNNNHETCNNSFISTNMLIDKNIINNSTFNCKNLLPSKCSELNKRTKFDYKQHRGSDNNVKTLTHIFDPTTKIVKIKSQTSNLATTKVTVTNNVNTLNNSVKIKQRLKIDGGAFSKTSATDDDGPLKIITSKLLVNPEPNPNPESGTFSIIETNAKLLDNNYKDNKIIKMPADVDNVILKSTSSSSKSPLGPLINFELSKISQLIQKSTKINKFQNASKSLNEFSNTTTIIDHHNRRRRRGRLRIIEDNFNKIFNLSLLLLLLTSLLSILLSPMVSLSKFYHYVNNVLASSKRLANNLKFLAGILVVTTILPINLVNSAPSSPISRPSSSSSGSQSGVLRTIEKPLGDIGGDDGISNFGFSNEREFFFPSQSNENFDDEDNTNSNITNDNVTHKAPLFPKDLFTQEQLENGAVIFHIIGVIYMFVALAIVCDEFFVPALDVIIEKLDITDDVAGATFMAAGGSAPELFTSVIGVFVSFDDVGIGTIVGSAVFNILFVIGMCALFSKTLLTLTWWPLFRDCSFYSISLIVLIYFFRDNLIYWWEALILFSIYVAYVGFMKWNQQVERCVKKVIYQKKVTRVRSTDQLMPAGNAANSSETSMATQPGGSMTSRAASESRSGPPGSSTGATGNSSGSTQTGAKFRHGLLQLMIHTIDPLHDDDVPGKVDEKATQLHAIASLKVLLDATKPHSGGATTSAANHVKINLKETTLVGDRPNGNIDTTLDSGPEIQDVPEALSMAWPTTGRKRLTYLLVAPIVFPLWITLPDTKTPKGKRYYPVTFIGSIVWIAAYSYLMVWWANVAGDTAKIPPEVMGLTFLAAGTSIPDLITSVIVARKGFGDMAVSSSVGSNIFDVTVGLPIPWLLYGIIYDAPVEVNSVGMVCSITILFMMLIFVVISIACFRWRMNKGLGFTMFLLYFVFVAVSLLFEYDVITCPV